MDTLSEKLQKLADAVEEMERDLDYYKEEAASKESDAEYAQEETNKLRERQQESAKEIRRLLGLAKYQREQGWPDLEADTMLLVETELDILDSWY